MAEAPLRIEEVYARGLRSLKDVRLPLSRLTVLIGDNGSGKSSLVEACEILCHAAGEHFLDEFHRVHGGLRALLHPDVPALELGLRVWDGEGVEGTPQRLQYHFALSPAPGGGARIVEEALSFWAAAPDAQPLTLLRRAYDGAQVRSQGTWQPLRRYEAGRLLLTDYRNFPAADPDWAQTARARVIAALERIQVHLPFEVMPSWAAQQHERRSALRGSVLIAPAPTLERLGGNLANAYHSLRNDFEQAAWQQTMDYVRRGLGDEVEDVTTWADPGGGHIGLGLKFRGRARAIYAAQLSDGMLAFLAFVALFRLSTLRGPAPSLLAFDEPDLHLHPHLLMRVLDFFESMARDFPVLLVTHSDRLLDGLSDPASSVILCELDEERSTRMARPDPVALERWLQRYRGLGDLRSAGHDASVMTKEI